MASKCLEKQKSKSRQSIEVIPKKARDKARGSLREIAANGISSPKGDTGIVFIQLQPILYNVGKNFKK